jgi:hypothetical protein
MPNRHSSYAVSPSLHDTRKYIQYLPMQSQFNPMPRVPHFDAPRIVQNHRELIPSPHSYYAKDIYAKFIVGRGV